MYDRPMFPKPRFTVSEQVSSTTASGSRTYVGASFTTATSTNLIAQGDSLTVGENFSMTITATTGTSWLSFTTSASTNGFRLKEGASLDVKVPKQICVVSDSTTAKVQGIIWEA